MIPIVLAFALAWRFVPADANTLVAMDWKRVLNSPLSAELRREIPPQAAPVLASINFIEGIDRVVWTPGLVVLEGSFDLDRLKDMATSDGGAVKPYKKAELLAPAEDDAPFVGLVSPTLVLLGSPDLVRAAIDRAEKSKAPEPAPYDLWIRTVGSTFDNHEFGVRLDTGVAISSKIRFRDEANATAIVDGSEALGLTASRQGKEATLSGHFSNEDFRRRQWRPAIESPEVEKPTSHPGVIRIYGLDDGVKELPTTKK